MLDVDLCRLDSYVVIWMNYLLILICSPYDYLTDVTYCCYKIFHDIEEYAQLVALIVMDLY